MPQISFHYNPFQLHKNVEIDTPRVGQNLTAYLSKQKKDVFHKPFVCMVNGEAVLRKDWKSIYFEEETLIAFIYLPQGGGDGGKILRTVLLIAVMVAAPYAGAALAGSIGVTSTIGVSMLTATVAMAGSVLVNALIPPPSPQLPGLGFNNSAPSPTYSLQAQGNQARLGEPIPVLYGRHILYPDFAATPYSEFIEDDQYLNQLHVIGHGNYDIEQIRIEDTPISSFEDIQYQIINPSEALTLFDPHVVTAPEVAGQEIVAEGIGPFITHSAEHVCHKLSFDIVANQGLYFANDDGSFAERSVSWQIDVRRIDDLGAPLEAFYTLATETLTGQTNTAIRKTFLYTVPEGRYEVKIKRLDEKDTSSRAGHEIRWQSLKSHITGTALPQNITFLAMRMRATDNLSQRSSRMVNVIATRKLPVWSPDTGWSAPQATTSIAWALADTLRAPYGAALSDERIDLEALYQLNTLWESRGDTFNGVFDSKRSAWEALSKIAQVGRTMPFMQGGIVRFVRDEPKTVPVALFTPRNIVKNSFNINFVMPGEDTADSVTISYYSSRTWSLDETTVSLPDSSKERTATVNLFGCTNALQAEREGLYMAAANRYRRQMVSFKTELEGLIPTYGDLIAISHDLPHWGIAGEIIQFQENCLTLSEPVTFDGFGNYYISLRRKDGSLAGPFLVTAGNSGTEVILQEPLDITPYTGQRGERTHFCFGSAENLAVKARVLSVKPRGEQVEISAVVEHNLVHQN